MFHRIGRLALICAGVFCLVPTTARAVPSFARQTGLDCTACHTAFPQLTSFGRSFKLNGYTMSNDSTLLPPVAGMVLPSFTHTNRGQAGGAAPDFNGNDNVAVTQASLFYAGRLFGNYPDHFLDNKTLASYMNHFGAFIQGTYDGIGNSWAWDNAEIRVAASHEVFGKSVVFGAYANNNPTLQDVWNTVPAWGFPFTSSGLAPTPAAGPLIGSLGQQVAGGGAYALFADLLYLEFGGYSTLAASAQQSVGVDPTGQTQIPGFAPYWRVALQHSFGEAKQHYLEIGTYGLRAATYPGRDPSAGRDHFTDLGFDAQYQFASGRNDVTVLLNAIHERASWTASFPLGLTDNRADNLWTASATASYLFDKTYGGDIQYFAISGDKDATLYGGSRTGSPGSTGWIFQLDWLPFNKHGGPSIWPKSNLKLSLQYVHYLHFDGSSRNYDGMGRSAADNDTLYLQAWLAL